MKNYVDNLSHCMTIASILKVAISPSDVMTLAVVSPYIMIIAITNTPLSRTISET